MAFAARHAGGSTDITREQAISIANAFRQRAARGVLAQSDLISIDATENNDDTGSDSEQEFAIMYGDGRCDVRRSDGKITYLTLHRSQASGGGPSNVIAPYYPMHPLLTEAQAVSLAQEYLAVAGYTETYRAHKVRLEAGGDVYSDLYLIEMQPVRGEAKVLSTVYIDMEPTTGMLARFAHPAAYPASPASLVPAITAAQARNLMLAHLAATEAVTVLDEFDTVDLAIVAPVAIPESSSDHRNWDVLYTSEELALGASHQGMLVYEGCFGDLDSIPWPEGFYSRSWWLVVDAATGEMKVVHRFGGSFGSPGRVPKRLRWDWSPGPIAVGRGKASRTVSEADVRETHRAKPPKAGEPVLLSRGRLCVACLYDPQSGLVWREIRGKRVYGRPTPALAQALRALCASPTAHVKKPKAHVERRRASGAG